CRLRRGDEGRTVGRRHLRGWRIATPRLESRGRSAHRTGAVIVLKDFKTFLLRGNVVDLAVAVVIGAAFGALVTALVRDILTPIIAVIAGKHDFSSLSFTINKSRFAYGDFINYLIAFISIAAAVFFFVVQPVN